MKNKFLLSLVFFIAFLFLGANFVFALEAKYPDIPGLPSLNGGSLNISSYIGYFFGFLIYVGGVLALISFVVGAIGLISPNIESHNDAKDRMKNALLGLILTASSFLILQTINPTFVAPTMTSLPGVAGIFYTNGSEKKPCPSENPDTSTIPQGFNNIQYICSGSDPALLIWMFPDKNFENYQKASVKRITCNNTIPIGEGSFQLAFETPGIYYCLGGCGGDNMCSGYMSNAISSSQDVIDARFSGKIGAVRVVNDPENNTYYEAIFHQQTGLDNVGKCSYPIPAENNNQKIVCEGLDFPNASAVNIFMWNKGPASTSGGGVTFYSEAYGASIGTQNRGEGFCAINNDKIIGLFSVKSDKLVFNSGNSVYSCGYSEKTMSQYKDLYKTFSERHGSINIKGNYLVGLFSSPNTGGAYCQVFEGDANNLNMEPFIASGQSIESIYILPKK